MIPEPDLKHKYGKHIRKAGVALQDSHLTEYRNIRRTQRVHTGNLQYVHGKVTWLNVQVGYVRLVCEKHG